MQTSIEANVSSSGKILRYLNTTQKDKGIDRNPKTLDVQKTLEMQDMQHR